MHDAQSVVVVGGGGFIGRALTLQLAARRMPVTAVVRAPTLLPPGVAMRVAGDFAAVDDWRAHLAGARAVVHLASRAHAPADPDEARWAEREAALATALTRSAAALGAERFLLMSSIKVMGAGRDGTPFRAEDAPAPADAYGRVKLRVERAVAESAAASGLPLVILRPPLVYGPGVRANFLALLRLVDRGLPLPLASIDNRRSFLFLDNLAELAGLALTHPAAPGRILLARDDAEVSTPALIALIARALGRTPRLFPCPPVLLRRLARLAGRAGLAERLVDSLTLDDAATRVALGWQPRVALAQGIAATGRWFRTLKPAAPDGGRAPSRL